MSAIKALVLRTAGTNCDAETAEALRQGGAEPVTLHINRFLEDRESFDAFQILAIPGGFSYGDDVAAGKILANELRFKLRQKLDRFVDSGRKVIGICNGFQVLVKTGYLPGTPERAQTVTLAHNESGRFQCHWVKLKRENSICKWLNTTDDEWELPIAHGEGRFVTQDSAVLNDLEKNKQIVWRYSGINPNGSVNDIAGICNKQGNVIGLMPHPERHLFRTQHPEWTRGKAKDRTPVGFQFFKALVQSVRRSS